MDVVLHQMEWGFPEDLGEGWVLDLCIDDVLWESIPVMIQPSGYYSFKTHSNGVFLPKGTLVSTHIRCVSDEEEGDHYMNHSFESRYSVFLSGLTVVSKIVAPLSETFSNQGILKWNWFNDWQADNS